MMKKCAKIRLKIEKNCYSPGGYLKNPHGFLGGLAKKPCLSTREEGDQKCPKICPHGLWMTPNKDMEIQSTTIYEDNNHISNKTLYFPKGADPSSADIHCGKCNKYFRKKPIKFYDMHKQTDIFVNFFLMEVQQNS